MTRSMHHPTHTLLRTTVHRAAQAARITTMALACAMALPIQAQHTVAAPLAAPVAQASPWLGLWQGTIGKNKVVLALSIDPDSQRIEGRYFYERYGRDLSLWGPAANTEGSTALQLLECPPDYSNPLEVCDKPSGTFTLQRPSQAGQLEGFWQGHALPGRRPPPGAVLKLTRAGAYNPTAEAFRDPYEQKRLKGLKPSLKAGGAMGPVSWQTLVDARSGIATPQFTRGASPTALARINTHLKKTWQERISNALTAIDHEDEVKVVFANQRWLATNHSLGAYFPGAAHPITAFSASTFDLSTGQVLDWGQWFRFTTPQSHYIDINRRDLLAAQVLKSLTALVTTGAQNEGTPDDHCAQIVLDHYQCKGGRCASVDLMGGRVPNDWMIWPTQQGLAVAPDIYSEADRACRGNEVVLPWKQARAALLRPQNLP